MDQIALLQITTDPYVWATNLTGNYPDNAREYLYLPLMDLTATANPTLSMRIWSYDYFYSPNRDGTNVEIYDALTNSWTPIDSYTLPYQTTTLTTIGVNAWAVQGGNSDEFYRFAAFDLTAFSGQQIQVRLAFRSDAGSVGWGTYIDDIRLDNEATDPDGDGILGVIAEWNVGSDPFLSDTDGDGAVDGADSAPTNAAVGFVGAHVATAGESLDTYAYTDGGLWQYGVPTTGVNRTSQITADPYVWATNLTGTYFDNAREYLYLPLMDLYATANPTLSMRVWSYDSFYYPNVEGTNVEVYDVLTSTWTSVDSYTLPYQSSTFAKIGVNAWAIQGGLSNEFYRFAAFDLSAYSGQQIQVRLAFRSTASNVGLGTYIDDIRLDDEATDPDGDGILGVLNEWNVGSDPFLSDTDGDGFNDGVELVNGSDSRNPFITPTVFTTLSTLTTGISATSIAVFDMNQDTYSDMLVGTLNGDLYTYTGTGAGTFSAVPTVFSSGAAGMNQFAAGFINQDLYTDIVMPSETNSSVVVMYNDGNGVFSPYTFALDLNTYPKAVAIADLNNDGYADILAPNFGIAGTGNSISSLRSLGGTNFTLDPSSTVNGASGLFAIIAGDFNADGYADAAVTGQVSNTITIMTGTSNTPIPTHFTVGSVPEYLAIGDLDGSGQPSIVISNRGSASISIMINSTLLPAGFTAPTTILLPLGTETPMGIAIGDVDGDGVGDIVVADPANNQILLLKSDGLGGLINISSYAVTGSPTDVKLVDVNGDGQLDIVTINQTTLDINHSIQWA
ncbi:MAG: FG-GAP-like repeat-containing protein [Ghiorsea sp.]|nr:FG-GAP-like repeat-containing protein [Ghiorsea sp.]